MRDAAQVCGCGLGVIRASVADDTSENFGASHTEMNLVFVGKQV